MQQAAKNLNTNIREIKGAEVAKFMSDHVRESKEERAEDFEDLLDDALADFASTSAPKDAQEDIAPIKKAAPAFNPLPDRSSKKSSTKGKPFNPLPDRTRREKEKPKDPFSAQTAQQPEDAQGTEAMEQNLARLMQELDLAGAQTGSGQASSVSDTLRQMMQQSEGLNPPRQPSSHDGLVSEPMFAGLQEQLGGGEGGFGGLADTLMRQLLAKDVLYQPMKDIGERYPDWLAAHRDVITAEEMGQYEEQYKHIKRILRMYETEPDNFGELFDALQQMQACGQPPQDIVNDLAPGMAFDQEGLPSTLPGSGHPPGCCVQ